MVTWNSPIFIIFQVRLCISLSAWFSFYLKMKLSNSIVWGRLNLIWSKILFLKVLGVTKAGEIGQSNNTDNSVVEKMYQNFWSFKIVDFLWQKHDNILIHIKLNSPVKICA